MTKLFTLFLIGICILEGNSLKHKRKINAGSKYFNADDEEEFQRKIQSFIITTLQLAHKTIDNIHDKSDGTFTGVMTDLDDKANSIATNLIEHFRKYSNIYEGYRNAPDTPSCLHENYSNLKSILSSLQGQLSDCRNIAIADIQNIKTEIDTNTIQLRGGIKLVVERMNQCVQPWILQESAKCATKRSEQIRRTMVDIQKISENAHENILNRLEVIIETSKDCADEIIKDAQTEEIEFLKNASECISKG